MGNSFNESNTSSFMRKRLIGGVRYNKGGKPKKEKGDTKKKVDMLNMNEEEFAKYLLKKYGQQKGMKRYDSMLFNKKTMSINALKKKSTNIT
jgi:hypothetical protein